MYINTHTSSNCFNNTFSSLNSRQWYRITPTGHFPTENTTHTIFWGKLECCTFSGSDGVVLGKYSNTGENPTYAQYLILALLKIVYFLRFIIILLFTQHMRNEHAAANIHDDDDAISAPTSPFHKLKQRSSNNSNTGNTLLISEEAENIPI